MRCEWNPSTSLLALMTDTPHGMASWIVGTGKRSIHICNQCAALKRFKKCKRRRLITAAEVVQNFEVRLKNAMEKSSLVDPEETKRLVKSYAPKEKHSWVDDFVDNVVKNREKYSGSYTK